MRWAGHTAPFERRKIHTMFRHERLKEGGHMEKPGIDGRIMIKIDLKIQDGRLWTGFMWLRMVIGGNSGDHRNETSGSLKFWGNMMLDVGELRICLVQIAKRRIPPSPGNRIAVFINERHGIQFKKFKLPFNKPSTCSYTHRHIY
jgi:hypothetical protein